MNRTSEDHEATAWHVKNILQIVGASCCDLSKIVSEFSARRAVYERVRTMFSEEEDVESVADWGIERKGSLLSAIPPEGGMSLQRYQEYLALLKEIGADGKEHVTQVAHWWRVYQRNVPEYGNGSAVAVERP